MRKRKDIADKRLRILERDDFSCVYCGSPATQVDHILPVSYKENNSEENLVACCSSCNLIAGDKIFPSFQEKKEFILLVRSTKKWKKRFLKSTSICTSCKKSYNPRTKNASMFLCPNCHRMY